MIRRTLVAMLMLIIVVSGSVFADVKGGDLWTDTTRYYKSYAVYGHWQGDHMGFADGEDKYIESELSASIAADGTLMLAGTQSEWQSFADLINTTSYKPVIKDFTVTLSSSTDGIIRFVDGIDQKYIKPMTPAHVVIYGNTLYTYINHVSVATPADSQGPVYSVPARKLLEAHGYELSWMEGTLIIERPFKQPTQEVTQ